MLKSYFGNNFAITYSEYGLKTRMGFDSFENYL